VVRKLELLRCVLALTSVGARELVRQQMLSTTIIVDLPFSRLALCEASTRPTLTTAAVGEKIAEGEAF
jgi:hypothetical protein